MQSFRSAKVHTEAPKKFHNINVIKPVSFLFFAFMAWSSYSARSIHTPVILFIKIVASIDLIRTLIDSLCRVKTPLSV